MSREPEGKTLPKKVPNKYRSRSRYMPDGSAATPQTGSEGFSMPLANRRDRRHQEPARRPDETRWTKPSLAKRKRDRKQRANSR